MTKLNLKYTLSGYFFDALIGAHYNLMRVNAKDLSNYLRKNLTDKGIDYNKYNSEFSGSEWSIKAAEEVASKTATAEIYEYQNFFLLETDNDYILLDGFRRLLWYLAPDVTINVRVYKAADLSSQNILTLMVYLNHFKFVGGGGYYHDRGFALLLRTVFNLNINKYRAAFDAYLSKDYSVDSYGGSERSKKGELPSVKERITNPHFASDILFLEKLREGGQMVNRFTGAYVYQMRQTTEATFDAERFIELAKNNSIITELLGKYAKVGNNQQAEQMKIIRQIMQMYENIFIIMLGGEVKKTYAEKIQEAKEASAKLKKDKSLTKITTAGGFVYEAELLMKYKLHHNEPFKLVAVVHPEERDDAAEIPTVVELTFRRWAKGNARNSWTPEMKFIWTHEDGTMYEIYHNSNTYGYTTKYYELYPMWKADSSKGHYRRKVEVFVNFTKNELKYVDDNRQKFVVPQVKLEE